MSYQPHTRLDYKPRELTPSGRTWHRFHLHLTLILVVAGMLGLVLSLAWTDAEAVREVPGGLAPGERLLLPLELPEHTALPLETTDSIDDDVWQTVRVASGDTLSAIFSRVGLSPGQLHEVVNLGPETKRLTRLLPGQEFRLRVEDGQLSELVYTIDRTSSLHLRRQDDGLRAEQVNQEIETRLSHAHGVIESSLFAAAQQVGLSDNLTMEMANIFGWDIDFALDIRSGDSFSLLYEEQYLAGDKIGEGSIVAAEFRNRGRTVRAIRYTDSQGRSGYYSPEGLSMRKAFLRTPVDFRRISSRFQPERYHPVLGVRRPHRGVDYAAPTGTPIKAAGDGRIRVRGTQGGYGSTVIIDHGGGYETLYAHMSNFRRGQRVGSRVKQGEIIGYVGQSGLATGPHLHYEFRVNGVHRNPLTVRLPNAAPIHADYKEDFLQASQGLIAQLELLGEYYFASTEPAAP